MAAIVARDRRRVAPATLPRMKIAQLTPAAVDLSSAGSPQQRRDAAGRVAAGRHAQAGCGDALADVGAGTPAPTVAWSAAASRAPVTGGEAEILAAPAAPAPTREADTASAACSR